MERNLDGSELEFEQDKRISFEETTHTYTVAGIGEMTPVSSVVAKFFKPFDAEYWSRRKTSSDVAAQRLCQEWEAKGLCAAGAGTHMHRQIELYINSGAEPDLHYDFEYNGTLHSERKSFDISHEWNLFKRFDAEVDYQPFRTEWKVFDAEHRIAGTIDLLCRTADGAFEIYDWKRSSKIDPDEINRWSSGINGLEHLTDTSYTHYCLQQNLYRYILETYYGLRIERMNLVVLHPSLDNYEIVEIPRMDYELKIIFDYLKRSR
ncbi:MAG: hypothetical protein ACI31A_01370 [Candidatus Limisoma sp.]